MARSEDFRLPVARSWQLLLLGVTFGLALALGGPRTVSAQEGAMAADCEGNSPEVETDCEFGDGQEFTVAIQVTSAPDGGYLSFQAMLRWDADVLDYLATSDPRQEVVWPACDIPARTDNSQADPPDSSVLFGCVPLDLQPRDDVGPVLLYTFVCTGQGTGTLTIESGDQVSFFLDAGLQPVEPSLEAASVTCGGPDVERPEPEVAVNPPPPLDDNTRPPDPDTQPPDGATAGEPTATPGGPTVTPGGPTVTPGATVIRTPTLRPGDEEDDDDDGGLPVWGWTLIGLAIAAGVGGGGFLAWRRMQAPAEGAEPDQPAGEGAEPDQPRGESDEPDQPS